MFQNSKILVYTLSSGKAKVEVLLDHENVWMTQAGLAELYQTSTQNITMHIKHIYIKMENQKKNQLVSKTYKLD